MTRGCPGLILSLMLCAVACKRTPSAAPAAVELKNRPVPQSGLTVWVDGTLVQAASNRTYSDGKVLTFNGQQSVMVWTGSSGTTYFTVNGKSLGHLGPSGVSETWLFSPSGPPKQTQHP